MLTTLLGIYRIHWHSLYSKIVWVMLYYIV